MTYFKKLNIEFFYSSLSGFEVVFESKILAELNEFIQIYHDFLEKLDIFCNKKNQWVFYEYF